MRILIRLIVCSGLIGLIAGYTVNLSAAAPTAPSFSGELVPIFRSRCVSCHFPGQGAGQLTLTPAQAYANLVNVNSSQVPAMKRVAPGNPEQSYLIYKLKGTHIRARGSGTRMPPVGGALDTASIKKFSDWIKSGAPKN